MNFENGYVGVFWVDVGDCRVYSAKLPLRSGENYGDFIVHNSCHYDMWNSIRVRNPKWRNLANYEDVERGRCVFNRMTEEFVIYLCPSLKGRKKIEKAILQEFSIPSTGARCRFDFSDEHYVIHSFGGSGIQPQKRKRGSVLRLKKKSSENI